MLTHVFAFDLFWPVWALARHWMPKLLPALRVAGTDTAGREEGTGFRPAGYCPHRRNFQQQAKAASRLFEDPSHSELDSIVLPPQS